MKRRGDGALVLHWTRAPPTPLTLTPLSPPLRRRKAALEAAGGTSGALVPSTTRPRRPPRDAALRELARFLLPLAGRRIGGLVALAIVRTALSNRLARVQV